jgi:hypothetical protein
MKFLFTYSLLFLIFTAKFSSAATLNPAIIIGLKKEHVMTCVPTIKRQTDSVSPNITISQTQMYCECLSNFYFNDFTTQDLAYLKQNRDLPTRLAANRKSYQEYCASLHFY